MKITMCEKEYYFKLKKNNVCVLYIPTTNSKLEKFVQKQHSLWQLTGSSLGALRELVAVAGIQYFKSCQDMILTIHFLRSISHCPITFMDRSK
jgi:hypothetical protein